MSYTPRSDLAQLQRPVRIRITVAAFLQAVATVLAIAPMVATVEIARRLLAGEDDGLWPIAWITIGLLAARVVLYVLAGALSHLADVDLSLTLRHRLSDHLAVLPLGWFAGGASGRVKSTVQDDVATLHHAVAHARGDLASAIAGPAVITAYLFWVDWELALLTVALLAVAQTIRMRLAARASDPVRRIAAANTELAAAAVELVQSIEVVKAFATSGAPARFEAATTAYADADEEAQRIFVRQRSLTRATVAPGTVLLLLSAAGVGAVALGRAQPTDIVAFALLGIGLFEQLTPIYSARGLRDRARAAAHRIAELLREPPQHEPSAGHARMPGNPPTVQIASVSFGYTSDREVLHDIDAVLEPGTITALVGPSGAGKSTLATLLAGFYDVTEGAIRIGGVDLRNLDRETLYRHVGFLFQDVVLLQQSVRDNIALADPDADEVQVHAAARAAAIHDRILALPRGYDSVIGVDARLSGGEKQRISIARTLLADTPIIVLDEATAFADPESEAAIQDALAELAVGRTLLVIAHRLYTITKADQILVLDSGRIIERGRHTDLLTQNGCYSRLWRAQHQGHDT